MAKKSTKKFQKNHLKHTIEQRKVVQAFNKKTAKNKRRKPTAEQEYAGKPDKAKKAVDSAVDQDTRELFTAVDGDQDEGEVGDFTEFLEKEDQDLLNESEEELEDEDILSDVSDDEQGEEEEEEKEKDSSLSRAQVAKWKTALVEENSIKTLNRVAVAFRAAVNVGKDTEKKYKYTITDPEVYNDVVMLTLTQFPVVLDHHVPVLTGDNGRRTISTASKKFQQLVPVLKSLSSSLLALLADLSEPKTTTAVLTACEKLVPYFATFRRFIKSFIKTVVDIWSQSSHEPTRLSAWVVVRSIAESGDAGMLELCMKTSYAGMIKNARQTTVHTMPLINFMKNSAASLYGLNSGVAYQTAFDYIRQLAIHLRNSVVHKTKDSYKAVYNWQYIHSLDFWRRVLSLHAAAESSPLRPLIYPFVQVTLGAMRLIPAPQYFPLRFTLFHTLLGLARDTDVYIPLLPDITEMLTSTAVTKPGKPSTLHPFDFDHNIRANTAYLGTKIYQTGVCDKIVECVLEFYGLYAKHIAFPELVVPCVITLKRYARGRDKPSTKQKQNVRFFKQLLELVDRLELNSKYIQDKRKNVEFGPANTAMVREFMKEIEWESTPLGQYLAVQRQVRDERMRVLRQSLE
ncbi:Noc2p family-domain-containing protein [Lipomyces arxii]|uniref:Noc2p family-domain-containing protein n=1 Tax=Lipomyces arxii TaxID=56418 RepID=UPI0034CF2E46